MLEPSCLRGAETLYLDLRSSSLRHKQQIPRSYYKIELQVAVGIHEPKCSGLLLLLQTTTT